LLYPVKIAVCKLLASVTAYEKIPQQKPEDRQEAHCKFINLKYYFALNIYLFRKLVQLNFLTREVHCIMIVTLNILLLLVSAIR
jgi:hypothetical protein